MIKLGFSTRSYVLTGPDEDTEEESQFTITELKQQRLEKIQQKELAEKEALAKQEKEREEKRKRDVERGVDWGLGNNYKAKALNYFFHYKIAKFILSCNLYSILNVQVIYKYQTAISNKFCHLR